MERRGGRLGTRPTTTSCLASGAAPGGGIGGNDGANTGLSTHGQEGRVYLVRAPLMPMLSVPDEKPIIFRAFKNPARGQALAGLGTKTLGTRKRTFDPGDTKVVNRFLEEEAPPPVVDTPAQRLVLWSPAPGVDDPEGRLEVAVDPALTKVLREHQRLGVQFIFDCLMGFKSFEGYGCILADDMGLGKTLQSVTAIWTLLTQGGPQGKAACRKALVVCPASLVKNWESEFKKWLDGRCKCVAVAAAGQAAVSATFGSFRYNREAKVLIASYETFRGHASEVADCGIDLIVCDEAHKLKNDEAATTRCISGLSAKRRLLLSGTPIQNNLDEFFTLASVANPGIFGDPSTFRRNYALPILRGREPTATAEERKLGAERLAAISEVTEQFVLRRTNRLNARFLPAKKLFNVFVEPTAFQRQLYRTFLESKVAQNLLRDTNAKFGVGVLAHIKKLQAVVNHPFLVRTAAQRLEGGFDDEKTRALFEEIDARDSGTRFSNQKPVREELSGKLLLLHSMLLSIKASRSGDKIVIISNWTSTLDVIEKMCDHNKWPVHRLDGTMSVGKRQKLVTDFNRPDGNAFAFLLSSKAGGCGLNLIGANRLVMYDPDWNPANDRQAMARIWRDGQRKVCYIYRFFTTGTIDEKVYQRQICKDGLSTMMMVETGAGGAGGEDDMKESLSADLVKDLFTFAEETPCATHDMLGCQRCRPPAHGAKTGTFVPQEGDGVEDDLNTWSHHLGTQGVADDILVEAGARMHQRPDNAAIVRAGSQQKPGVSFTMGCHIEFSEETKAQLEAEEKALQKQREERAAGDAAALEPPTKKVATAGSPQPAAAAASPTAPGLAAVVRQAAVAPPPPPVQQQQASTPTGQVAMALAKASREAKKPKAAAPAAAAGAGLVDGSSPGPAPPAVLRRSARHAAAVAAAAKQPEATLVQAQQVVPTPARAAPFSGAIEVDVVPSGPTTSVASGAGLRQPSKWRRLRPSYGDDGEDLY
eukprot:TRINITY_DN122693_c0_g1_i1.p1 TRINITY_DN122693_c0_g1~~TRINITY_DN122693_c0_g1_i1.p1  ORF type:complete len:987 (+),score=288.74 TRINITY_DN122693_c0_g1_i1:207-3167(+)